jgi:hypothetical protein
MGWTVQGSNPGGDEIFRTCPDWPWGPPSLLYNGYRVFPRVKNGQGMTLTPHPLLVPWSWKSRAIPLLPIRAVRPVQSLSACTRCTLPYNTLTNSDTFAQYAARIHSHICTLLHLAIAHIESKLKFDNGTNLFSLNWSLYITDSWSKSLIILHNTIMFCTGRKLNFILCHILFTSSIKLLVTQLINNRVSHSMASWHLFLEQ